LTVTTKIDDNETTISIFLILKIKNNNNKIIAVRGDNLGRYIENQEINL